MSLWWLFDSYNIAVRFTVLFPILLLQIFWTTLFLKEIFKEKKIDYSIFIWVLYFIFNTYFLYTSLSHLYILFGISLFPLLLYLYIKLLKSNSNRNLILFCLVYTISCIYELRITIISTFLLLLFSLVYLKEFKSILKNYKLIGLLFWIILLLNLFWLVLIFWWSFSSESEEFLTRWVFWNNMTNLYYSILAYKPYWDIWGNSSDFHLQPVPICVFFYLIIIIINFIIRRDKLTILSLFLVIFWAFLLKQDNTPFVWSYKFLYNNFPLFNIFREWSKFSIISVLWYTLWFTIYIRNIWVFKNEFLKKGCYIFCVAIILYPALPMFTQNVKYTYKPKIMHEDYIKLNKTIVDDNDYYKTLSVPLASKLTLYSFKNPSINFISNDLRSILWVTKSSWEGTFTWMTQEFFEKKEFHNLLDIAWIKYILLPFEDKINKDSAFPFYWERTEYINILEKNLGFLKHEKIWRIDIFTNNDYFSPVFLSSNIVKNLSFTDNTFKNLKIEDFFNNVWYKFTVKNLNFDQYINLSQKTDNGWKLYLKYNNVLDNYNKKPLLNKVETLSFLNSWIISKDNIVSYVNNNYSLELKNLWYPKNLDNWKIDYKYYVQNPDWSINVELTLYYSPQSKLFLWLIISFTTFLLLVSYLAYDTIKNRKNIL